MIAWSPQAEYDSGKPDDVYLAYLPLAHIMEVPAIFVLLFCLPRLPAPRPYLRGACYFCFVFCFAFFCLPRLSAPRPYLGGACTLNPQTLKPTPKR